MFPRAVGACDDEVMDDEAETVPPDSPGPSRRLRFVFDAYTSEHAVYGIVSVTALVVVGWHFDTDLEVLLFILGTVGVFWLTHVYAGVAAGRRADDGAAVSIWRAIGRTAAHSIGMLLAMLLPCLALGAGTLGWIDEYVAYYLALWIGVASLAVIGWCTSGRNHRPWQRRLLSTVIMMTFGLAIIWLSSLVH